MLFFFFKQKTAYEMRISDWSSDVCSSDLDGTPAPATKTITQVGIQIDRSDGIMIRILNLHPRIQQSLSAKPLFAIEVGDDAAVLYSVGETPDAIESLDDVLVDQFYCYIGQETSTIHEIGRAPCREREFSTGK